jgi:hypothetical protein
MSHALRPTTAITLGNILDAIRAIASANEYVGQCGFPGLGGKISAPAPREKHAGSLWGEPAAITVRTVDAVLVPHRMDTLSFRMYSLRAAPDRLASYRQTRDGPADRLRGEVDSMRGVIWT